MNLPDKERMEVQELKIRQFAHFVLILQLSLVQALFWAGVFSQRAARGLRFLHSAVEVDQTRRLYKKTGYTIHCIKKNVLKKKD